MNRKQNSIEEKQFEIIVPASTANLGPGFDSVGMALSKYLKLTVRPSDVWHFEGTTEALKALPTGEGNLMYRVAKKVADAYHKELPPANVAVWSDVSLARGMGTSASAIVAGVELANQLADLKLSNEEKLHLATSIEGHPDNVGPSLFGGLFIGMHEPSDTEMYLGKSPNIDVVVVVPPYEVLTRDARRVLPESLPFFNAVKASAVSNMLVVGLLTEDWELVGRMMRKDLFHQPYREALVKEYAQVVDLAQTYGAIGTALSGAGPTIISIAKKGEGEKLQRQLASHFPHCEVACLVVPEKGVEVV